MEDKIVAGFFRLYPGFRLMTKTRRIKQLRHGKVNESESQNSLGTFQI